MKVRIRREAMVHIGRQTTTHIVGRQTTTHIAGKVVAFDLDTVFDAQQESCGRYGPVLYRLSRVNMPQSIIIEGRYLEEVV